MPASRITETTWFQCLTRVRRDFHDGYLALYSSWFGGIITDPRLMLIPADDHMVHRGDGVFEACKCVRGCIYNLGAHIRRLIESASQIGISLPMPPDALTRTIIETTQAGNQPECMIRFYLSRGPGGFTANPYECPEPQLYIVVTRRPPPFMERHPEGARIVISSIAVKPAPFASLKSCNYLPNALMEKQAMDAGADFAVAFDSRGFLAEGATENIGIITSDARLLFPSLDSILPGTTLLRVMDLAQALVQSHDLKAVSFADITRSDFIHAAEVVICGTTPDVTAVVSIDGKPVSNGHPGRLAMKLNALLVRDIYDNPSMRTPVFPAP